MFNPYKSAEFNGNSLETGQSSIPFYLPFALITPDAMIAGNKDFAFSIKKDFREMTSTLDDLARV